MQRNLESISGSSEANPSPETFSSEEVIPSSEASLSHEATPSHSLVVRPRPVYFGFPIGYPMPNSRIGIDIIRYVLTNIQKEEASQLVDALRAKASVNHYNWLEGSILDYFKAMIDNSKLGARVLADQEEIKKLTEERNILSEERQNIIRVLKYMRDITEASERKQAEEKQAGEKELVKAYAENSRLTQENFLLRRQIGFLRDNKIAKKRKANAVVDLTEGASKDARLSDVTDVTLQDEQQLELFQQLQQLEQQLQQSQQQPEQQPEQQQPLQQPYPQQQESLLVTAGLISPPRVQTSQQRTPIRTFSILQTPTQSIAVFGSGSFLQTPVRANSIFTSSLNATVQAAQVTQVTQPTQSTQSTQPVVDSFRRRLFN